MAKYSFTGSLKWVLESHPPQWVVNLDTPIEGQDQLTFRNVTHEQAGILESNKSVKGEIEINSNGIVLVSLSENTIAKSFNAVGKKILDVYPPQYLIEFTQPVDGETTTVIKHGTLPFGQEAVLVKNMLEGRAFSGECQVVEENGQKSVKVLSIRR